MVSIIDSITFSIMSPETVKSLATVRIITSDLYDADGYPVEGGAMDPRMGVVDPGLHCRTCSGGIGDCPGHFGYLELARPIIHVLYIKTVYTLLKITCRKCKRAWRQWLTRSARRSNRQQPHLRGSRCASR